jgi:hypothetical protein
MEAGIVLFVIKPSEDGPPPVMTADPEERVITQFTSVPVLVKTDLYIPDVWDEAVTKVVSVSLSGASGLLM